MLIMDTESIKSVLKSSLGIPKDSALCIRKDSCKSDKEKGYHNELFQGFREQMTPELGTLKISAASGDQTTCLKRKINDEG